MDSEQNTVFVFATSERGTLAALQHAASLTKPSSNTITILVPRVIDYGAPLNAPCPAAEAESLTHSFRDLASRVGVDASVRISAVRDPRHVAGRLVLGPSRIIVGGYWRNWRASMEQKLARELASDGHDVIFVDVETGQPQALHAAVPA